MQLLTQTKDFFKFRQQNSIVVFFFLLSYKSREKNLAEGTL